MAKVNARNNSNSDNWGGDNRSAWEPTMRNFGMGGRGGWRGINYSIFYTNKHKSIYIVRLLQIL